MRKELVVIGGGPAGLAAAAEAVKNGVSDVIILEREEELGGILKQCIHNGFGLQYFGEELTGPEYALRFINLVKTLGISYKTGTTVLELGSGRKVISINSTDGIETYDAGAVILAMGCRERTRGALMIPGSRPAGILTAGTAQRLVNINGYLPGKKVVILGSGDIGLIMARRLTLEGAEVKMVCEVMPHPGGLTRNIVQCLDDFGIPLYLSQTVVSIHGSDRVEGVTIAEVGKDRKLILETSRYVECDTLLLSTGLIPENELTKSAGAAIDDITSGPVVDESMQTSISGVFACGNVVHVHDLVDNVTMEALNAGRGAARFLQDLGTRGGNIVKRTCAGEGVRYVVPQIVNLNVLEKGCKLYFRVDGRYEDAILLVECGGRILYKALKARISPGEIESVFIDKALLEGLESNGDIVVRIESRISG